MHISNLKAALKQHTSLKQRGALHYVLPLVFIVIFAVAGVGLIVYGHADTANCADPGSGTEGQQLAATAKYEYCVWNGGKNWQGNHVSQNTLMSLYTDGSPHEEWCADFISYVFKAAGFKFTKGTSGWDEKASSLIVDMNGVHRDAAGHKPQLGDVVYLQGSDYPAGHVEIVVNTKPLTFIYGNSGTIDPTTGNGEMREGGLPTDIQYYISPN